MRKVSWDEYNAAVSGFEKGYRVETGFKPSGTVADVVKYEQKELGNNLGITNDQLKELEKYPASAVKWVTRTKAEAKKYSDQVGDIEEVSFKRGEIIADIGEEGVLVLEKKANYLLI